MRNISSCIFGFFYVFLLGELSAQIAPDNTSAIQKYIKGNDRDVYDTKTRFIENIGQYGDLHQQFPELGKIVYAYEGFDVPVLFTTKGIIFLHRKIEEPALTMQEREEHKKMEEEIEEMEVKDRAITMEWVNSNNYTEILAEEQAEEYHTYGLMQGKARAYKKLIYKNLYTGNDLVFTFGNNTKTGFEYSLVVRPGADLNLVHMHYGGELRQCYENIANVDFKEAYPFQS